MSVDVADIVRQRSGPHQCSCHGQAGAMPAWLRAHDVVGIARHAITPHLYALSTEYKSCAYASLW